MGEVHGNIQLFFEIVPNFCPVCCYTMHFIFFVSLATDKTNGLGIFFLRPYILALTHRQFYFCTRIRFLKQKPNRLQSKFDLVFAGYNTPLMLFRLLKCHIGTISKGFHQDYKTKSQSDSAIVYSVFPLHID